LKNSANFRLQTFFYAAILLQMLVSRDGNDLLFQVKYRVKRAEIFSKQDKIMKKYKKISIYA